DHYLKSKPSPDYRMPGALTYATGIDAWQVAPKWPMGKATPLYLQGDFALSWSKPGIAGRDSYVSDPAKPVPYLPRPVRPNENDAWRTWLVRDQRFVADRTDLVSYVTVPLDKPVHIA